MTVFGKIKFHDLLAQEREKTVKPPGGRTEKMRKIQILDPYLLEIYTIPVFFKFLPQMHLYLSK